MVITKEELREDIYLLFYADEDPDRDLALEIIKDIPDENGENPSGRVVKIKDSGSTTSVYKICIKNRKYFVKEFRASGLKRKIKNFMGKPRAIRSLKNGIQLRNKGIPAIKPGMAVIDCSTLNRNLLITEEIKGENLFQLLRNCEFNPSTRRQLLINLATIWRKLFQQNLLYRDPTLENFFLTPEESFRGEPPGIIIIDIDHIYSLPIMPEFLKKDALSRFFASSLIYLEKAGVNFPSQQELSQFYLQFFKGERSKRERRKFSRKVKKGTVNKLRKWNRMDLIKKRCL